MFAKYLLMEMTDCHPRVVIVTDRKELDKQIANTFAHTRLNPARATSGRHLVELLSDSKADIITTIINKFVAAEKQNTKVLSRDIFVLVDESHRSNYGHMATKMRNVFPECLLYRIYRNTSYEKRKKHNSEIRQVDS